MAFSAVNSVLYQVGKAIKKLLFTGIVDNQNDLNTRLIVVEAGANKIVIFDEEIITRQNSASLTKFLIWRAPSTFTLLDAKVGIYLKGAATGTLEMDILKSVDRDPANFSTVFTTKPSIALAGASNYGDSTNQVFDAGQTDVAVGDHLRMDITQLPVGLGTFTVYLIGEFN